MKKLFCIAAVAALCAAPVLAQTTLNLEVKVSAAQAAIGDPVTVTIEGTLGGTATDGLALFGVNVVNNGTASFDLCNQAAFLLEAPAGDMQQFDRNLGLTNPPGPPAVTGFSGTCNGSGGLWQVGGGQNTIGNTPGPTSYPVGTVVEGVANGTDVLAEGTITVAGTNGQTITLCLDTAFANTIDAGETGPVYAVSEVDPANITTTCATITIGAGLPPCVAADINCDGNVNGLDIGVVSAPSNWQHTAGSAANPRADVNGDGNVNGLDIGVISAPSNWQTSTGACDCN